jgi:hypothetical protein
MDEELKAIYLELEELSIKSQTIRHLLTLERIKLNEIIEQSNKILGYER